MEELQQAAILDTGSYNIFFTKLNENNNSPFQNYLAATDFRSFVEIEGPHKHNKHGPNSKLNKSDCHWVVESFEDLLYTNMIITYQYTTYITLNTI